jgi:hypothetical protein
MRCTVVRRQCRVPHKSLQAPLPLVAAQLAFPRPQGAVVEDYARHHTSIRRRERMPAAVSSDS